MRRRYATADVFTSKPLGGNPVAVVLDAAGLTTAQMQALAAEFNYVETTFVLPPASPKHTAHVRIFTPDREVPFAGHPNIGTAFLLARERAEADGSRPEQFVFEEAAGLVEVDLLYQDGVVVGADLCAPQSLTRRAEVEAVQAAACLSLTADDVLITRHKPQIVSVGLPFLAVELASREALRRARPNRQAYDDLFPLDDARAVYAYTRTPGDVATDGFDLNARMFTWRLVEDPATGSATAAVAGLVSVLDGKEGRFRALQGEDMGRPSTLLARTVFDGEAIKARIGGQCASMFSGTFEI